MASYVQDLDKKGVIHPPRWLAQNMQYEVLMGSIAYGVSTESSDCDVYGYTIPPKELIFPHLAGEIPDFGREKKRFRQWQEAHHVDPRTNKNYDFSIYGIVRFFSLVMENNPNMVDTLFVPRNCVLFSTRVGEMVRERRQLFLHKGSWHKFKGYAYSQLSKIRTKAPDPGSVRYETYKKYGYDVKFAYHVVRLLYEAEMILAEHTIDLQRHFAHLRAIRQGEVEREEIERWAQEKEKSLEKLYETSTLPYKPDEPKIKALLLECLEEHYGKLEDSVLVTANRERQALEEILEVIHRAGITVEPNKKPDSLLRSLLFWWDR